MLRLEWMWEKRNRTTILLVSSAIILGLALVGLANQALCVAWIPLFVSYHACGRFPASVGRGVARSQLRSAQRAFQFA
jgi:hypothetical protein